MVIGLVRVAQSILFLALSLEREIDWWSNLWGLDSLRECETVAVVYLDLAISIQLNIFSTRNKKFFFMTSEKQDASPPPSVILMVPVFASLAFATIIAATWPGIDTEILGSGAPLRGTPNLFYILVTWLYGLVWFVIVEFVKVSIPCINIYIVHSILCYSIFRFSVAFFKSDHCFAGGLHRVL